MNKYAYLEDRRTACQKIPMETVNGKILLLNPPYIKALYTSRKTAAVFLPLGLAYIAGYLSSHHQEFEILDANALDLSESETITRCIQSSAAVIGITAITNTMPIVLRIARGIKERTDKTVVVGGPHVTFTAEETLLNWPSVDIVVRGEGEITTSELLKTLARKDEPDDVQGITFRKNGKIVSTPDRPLVDKLDSLPYPARDFFPLDSYRPSCLLDSKPAGKKYASIISSRGCVNRCLFCSSSHFWQRFRTRSAGNLIGELDNLLTAYRIERIDFLDDVFTWDEERLLNVCGFLKKLNPPVRWTCYARVDRMTETLAQEMKQAGCFAVQFGIESGSQHILDAVRKNITVAQVKDAVACAKKYNLKVMGDFMIGLPGDTRETILETLQFAKSLKLNLAFFSITTPFPGTELFASSPQKQEYSKIEVFESFSLHGNSLYQTDNLAAAEIRQLYSKCVREFYLRPGYGIELAHWLWKNPWDIKNFYKLFRAFLESR